MKQDRLSRCLSGVDSKYIEEAEQYKKKRFRHVWQIASAAACLCLVLVGVFMISQPSGNRVQQWSARFSAEDYFKYNSEESDGMSSSGSIADIAIPYAYTRFFSDMRQEFESDETIPVIEDHKLFDCISNYNEDGSLYSLTFSWHQRGELYSDLIVTAGYQEVKQIEDCIAIELDTNGKVVTPAVTVTERDGIRIVAEGNINGKKTMTYQNANGWYQITGSWNNGFEPMAELLDWFWAHPIDFSRFTLEAGYEMKYVKFNEYPDAFSGYIPDFAAFGFTDESTTLSLKYGQPYAFEAHYIAHAPAEFVREGNYYDVEGWTNIHWCIATETDYYEAEKSLGKLEDLTWQMVKDELEKESNIKFMWDGMLISVYTNTPEETWAVLETLQ